jgi:hypothetical protein
MRSVLCLSLILTATAHAGDPSATTTEIAIARAKADACLRVQKLTGSKLPDCIASEADAARRQASALIGTFLAATAEERKAEEKKPEPKDDPASAPEKPKEQRPLFLQGGAVMVDDQNRVWYRQASGHYVLSSCVYVDGQIVCQRRK